MESFMQDYIRALEKADSEIHLGLKCSRKYKYLNACSHYACAVNELERLLNIYPLDNRQVDEVSHKLSFARELRDDAYSFIKA